MNPNIRALAHDAGLYVDLGHTLYPRAMSAEECEAAYAKFAESLIRACNQAVSEVPLYYEDYRSQIEAAVIRDCARAVLERFGVES